MTLVELRLTVDELKILEKLIHSFGKCNSVLEVMEAGIDINVLASLSRNVDYVAGQLEDKAEELDLSIK